MEIKDFNKAEVFLSFKSYDGGNYAYLFFISDDALHATEQNWQKVEPGAGVNFEDLSSCNVWIDELEYEVYGVEHLAEILVRDFVEARRVEVEGNNDAMAVDDQYTVTIFNEGEKVLEQVFTQR